MRFAHASPATPMAWLEWEVKRSDVPFDGADLQSGTPQALAPPGGTLVFDELAEVPTPTFPQPPARSMRAANFHWRARVATNNPLFPHTAWFSAPGSPMTETELRRPAPLPH